MWRKDKVGPGKAAEETRRDDSEGRNSKEKEKRGGKR